MIGGICTVLVVASAWTAAAVRGDGVARTSGQLLVSALAMGAFVAVVGGATMLLGYVAVIGHRLLGPVSGRLMSRLGLGRRPVEVRGLHPFEPVVFRTPAVRQVRALAVLCVAVLAFTFAHWSDVMAQDAGPMTAIGGVSTVLLGPPLLGWLVCLGWRCRLVLDRTGVRLVDAFSSHHVPWSAIESVWVRSYGDGTASYRVEVVTADESFVAEVPSSRTAEEAEALRELLLRGRDLSPESGTRPRDGHADDQEVAQVTATGIDGLVRRLPPSAALRLGQFRDFLQD